MRTAILTAVAAACLSILGGTSAHAEARFFQKPVGSPLPNSDTCRSMVLASSDAREVRPANATANNRTGGSISVKLPGASAAWNSRYAGLIKGDLAKPANRNTTTDEVLDWGACKWGIDSHIARGIAVQESKWRQSQLGDHTHNAAACKKIGKAAPCYQTYSLVQIKGTIHPGTYPQSALSVPFAVDYAMAFLHACYNGAFTWLGNGYRAGDIWGCVGMYYSGTWRHAGGSKYVAQVKHHIGTKAWNTPNFVDNP
jgi:autotransporter family porin